MAAGAKRRAEQMVLPDDETLAAMAKAIGGWSPLSSGGVTITRSRPVAVTSVNDLCRIPLARPKQTNPALLDGVLAWCRIFHDQPPGGPLASCGRSGFASL